MKGQTQRKRAGQSHRRQWYLCLLVLLGLSLLSVAAQPRSGRRRATRTTQTQTMQLPNAHTSGSESFESALAKQQGPRELPSNQSLKPSEVGQLAWAAQGVTVQRGEVGMAPAEPPAPMGLYFTLADGVYRYDPTKHALEQTSDKDARAELAAAVLNPTGTAIGGPVGGCQIVLTGSSRDFAVRYGTKARTAMLLLAGQMVQNIELQAMSLGLTYVPIDNANSVDVRRVLRLNRSTEPLYVLLVGYPASETPETATNDPVVESGIARAVLITPQRDFIDAELYETKRQLEAASVQTLIASFRDGRIVGSYGNAGQADLSLSQVKVDDFDAFILVGGSGAIRFINNNVVLNLVRQAATQRKVVAASGNAPTILASAGVVRGTRVTGLLTERDNLIFAGATYTGTPVERDGTLVTSTGAMAIPQFVTAITDALKGE